MPAHVLIVVGTGTDAGKTHVTCALLHAARLLGRVAVALKPVATGCSLETCDDALAHAHASTDRYRPPLFVFNDPIAPSLAALRAGALIDLERIVDAVDQLRTKSDLVIVETAGGLFSPLGPQRTNVDIIARVPNAQTLLVAPDRLGVLHDIASTWKAATHDRCVLHAVVLSQGSRSEDASMGTNADELERCFGVRVSTTFPRAAIEDDASHAAALRVFQDLRIF